MSVVVSSNVQEDYEDDFEKDLDWLISEESKSEEQDDEDIEAQIDRELEEDEESGMENDEGRSKKDTDDDGEEERWPTPMDPLESPFDPDVSSEQTEDDEDLEEEKKMMLQKIEQANRQLRDQEAPDQTRRRRLQFKDTLVDLVVPAQEYSSNSLDRPITSPTVPRVDSEVDGDVSGQMLKLRISSRDECRTADAGVEGAREGRVLVEKDGKFDLVSLREVESQGLLPPLHGSPSDSHRGSSRQSEPRKSSPLSSLSQTAPEPLFTPKPPPRPRVRPNSASHTQRAAGQPASKRRVQSANGASTYSTFSLSPQQKQLLTKQQQRRERLAREEEERQREEEEQKRQENELAFRAWLLKKRQQLQEDKRVHKAQEMEKMSCKRDCCDPEEAFQHWLQRKQEQQLKEKQLEEMKKLEQDSTLYIHRPEECDKAFRMWLKRKRLEKRAEQHAARERSRRLVLEERRARRMRDILTTVNEIQAFRFNDPYSY